MRTHNPLIWKLMSAGIVFLCGFFLPGSAGAVGYEVIWTDTNSPQFPGGGLEASYAGDIDGDGIQEIVVSPGGTAWFRILDGMTGAEEFQAALAGNAISISMMDLDGDGTPEVLLQTTSGLAMVDFNTGIGISPSPPSAPGQSQLHSPEPNPFNPSTRIPLEISAPGRVEVVIHDVQGRVVRRLLDARLAAGRHELAWDGRHQSGASLASGTYFYNLRIDGRVVDSDKAVILR